MTQTATVIRVNGPGICEVRVRRMSACAGECGSCGGCETPDIDVLALNTERVGVGDRVLIESGRTLPLAAVVYLLPIALFFIGWIIHPAAGAIGVLLGVGAVLAANRFLQNRGGVTAKVVAVIDKE